MQTTTRRKPSIDDVRWAAVIARDKNFDGQFVYSVKSTGVYCRPSCPARLANRVNVAFHATPAVAERAGFRPCKRCRPCDVPREAEQAALVAEACRRIEAAEEPIKLDDLARAAGLSPFHFHRVFKSVTGVTPRAYALADRTRRVRDTLRRSATVTEAIHESGFGSNGRFYANSATTLGMTPAAYRAGGAKAEIRFAVAQCSLGAILVAATDKGVAAVLIDDDPEVLVRDLQDRFPKARLVGGDAKFETLAARVIKAVERPGETSALPLDIRGTAFQHRVWQALREIPPGATASYADIAKRIGKPKSVRAVAGACAANPAAVLVPCHRVVRTDGALSGYRWGIERKRTLLERERRSGTARPRNGKRRTPITG